MHRRAVLSAAASLLVLSPLLLVPSWARVASASTSKLLTLEELTGYATYVVVGTAHDHYSVWEELRSGRRIVTYTRVTVDQAIVGVPDKEVWVRTLGGAVDKIGQSVAGEAQLVSGSRAVLFLTKAETALVVTAMAQGQYPIVADAAGVARLTPSPATDMLVPRPGPAVWARERLIGATPEDAARAIAAAATTGGAR